MKVTEMETVKAVSILVLMEVLIWSYCRCPLSHILPGFNPCSDGSTDLVRFG